MDQFDGFAVSGDAQHHESEWDRELDDAINALPLRWRSVILSLRDGYTLDEIAAGFGITEGRVSQIKKQAIIRLRITLGITAGSRVHRPACKAQATERAL